MIENPRENAAVGAEPGSWKPVVEPDSGRPAMEAILAIADDLIRYLDPRPSRLAARYTSGHAWSLATAALFFAYLRSVTAQQEHEETSLAFLEAAIDLVEDAEEVRMSLYYGAAGLGWTIHHVGRLLGVHDAKATQVLDEEILAYLAGPGRPGEPYDLMTGLVGLGVYGFESADSAVVGRVVDRLAECAESSSDGLTWRTSPEVARWSSFPDGHYNLGLAHGVAGVVAFLAGAAEAGIRASTARQMLPGAVDWLLRQRLGNEDPRTFPWAVEPGRESLSWGYDPGWAYADAGIAAALISATRVTGDREAARHALSAGKKEAGNLNDLPLRNPGVGFGPAGYVQIFARLHQLTGCDSFRAAAQAALRNLLHMRVSGEGIGGFVSAEVTGKRRGPDVGFLGGASGIGLVLLGAVSDTDPAWDRLLLTSSLSGVVSERSLPLSF